MKRSGRLGAPFKGAPRKLRPPAQGGRGDGIHNGPSALLPITAHHGRESQEDGFSQVSAYLGGGGGSQTSSYLTPHPSTPHHYAGTARMAASNSLPRQHASPHLQLTQPSYGSFGLGSQEYLTNSGSQGARYQNPPPPAPLPARPAQALLAPGPEAPLYLLDELAKHANAVGELRDTVAKLDATVSRLEQRVGDHRADIGDIKEAVQGVHTFQGELMHTLSSQINSLQDKLAITHQAAVVAVPLQQTQVVPNAAATMDATPVLPTTNAESEHATSDSEQLPEFQLPRRQLFGSTMSTQPTAPSSITPAVAPPAASPHVRRAGDPPYAAHGSGPPGANQGRDGGGYGAGSHSEPPPASPVAAVDFLFSTDEEVWATSSSVSVFTRPSQATGRSPPPATAPPAGLAVPPASPASSHTTLVSAYSSGDAWSADGGSPGSSAAGLNDVGETLGVRRMIRSRKSRHRQKKHARAEPGGRSGERISCAWDDLAGMIGVLS